jgi:hypothetical protein
LRENPTDCGLNAQLGFAYQHLYQYPDAIRFLELSLEHCPDDPSVLFQLGVSRYVSMEREQGRALMEQAIGKARSTGDDSLADAYEEEKQAWITKWEAVPDLDWNRRGDE